MSEPIKVGDLVQVVKPRICCGNDAAIGRYFIVSSFVDTAFCAACGQRPVRCAVLPDGVMRCEVSRLKRIPPLSELEGEKRDEEITA